jgi:hypothetical protein
MRGLALLSCFHTRCFLVVPAQAENRELRTPERVPRSKRLKERSFLVVPAQAENRELRTPERVPRSKRLKERSAEQFLDHVSGG